MSNQEEYKKYGEVYKKVNGKQNSPRVGEEENRLFGRKSKFKNGGGKEYEVLGNYIHPCIFVDGFLC